MKTNAITLALAVSLGLAISGCSQSPHNQASTPLVSTTQTQADASAAANALFETIFIENVMASPMTQSYLGIKQDYDKWDQIGEAADAAALAMSQDQLARLQAINTELLDEQTLLSYQLLRQSLQDSISDHQWRLYSYPINQMYGIHSNVPSLLINQHPIDSVADAQAYISRLQGITELFKQTQEALTLRAQHGIIAPKFVFPHAIAASKNIITGAPFDAGEDSTLMADFSTKLAKLDITDSERQALLAQAKQALVEQTGPAYVDLIAYLTELETQADDKAGTWKFPRGDEFYANALKRTTTTDMTSAEIHQLGLDEVARIHTEMRAIMQQVGFEGSLNEFFVFMRDDPRFYHPNTAEGKAAYLAEAKAYIDTMESRLDEVFFIKPKADMIVKAVEPFREKSAGKAFYNQPAPDGSRPGIYYANLYDMAAMPTYQAEALAYHEGIPGHHMQIAIAQELENVPKFRRFGGYTAYIEGWGLYTEYFPKEMGLYQDPYSDFGRLSMELWRACRLVVDTGIHSQQWTREQGIEYYTSNTPNAESDAVKMVERHIVMPSQATAYKVGMNKILALREQAKAQLGTEFDIRQFHTLLLENGPLPLDVLEINVNNWVESKKS
ncbi:DUF885 family protein [Shewanella sp. NIFS-20-20]|uniref:DUF885 domain-containing protein n=1 Tax=Shewanella sp. NIFS-20-20 TaxID=2853806 RepID=UPI001C464426|nr:DUF885 domain-containing protein [Shewanella sp. NIFS-20-20]MBV7316627.1 DUF885 domain-containing protein [Shewanella sp. NIFS-20-20]